MTTPRIAIVIGGADCVFDDVAAATALVGDRPHTLLACNDMIADWPEYHVAVTLHPPKLEIWFKRRAHKGWPLPTVIWAHRRHHSAVTNTTPDWAGSVGLFAAKVALETQHDRVIVCGVPMTISPHYARRSQWTQATGFRRGWTAHIGSIRENVRSCSGWTAELLGQPTAAWLDQRNDRRS